jgi:ATP-dependent DNA helicase DinG
LHDDPNDPIWGPRPWPDWFQGFRPGQLDAIEEILESLKRVPAVLLDAPTGIGKTAVGEGVRRRSGVIPARAVYACTTKALQDQFLRSFPYADVIKGRSNYLTESGYLDQFGNPLLGSKFSWSSITCADCTFNSDTGSCRWCTSHAFCPYRVAKNKAIMGELAVVNTSYFITDSNMGPGSFADRELTIIDEADLIEQELLNHVEVVVTEKAMEEMWMLPPTRKTVENTWPEWVNEEALPKLDRYLERITKPWDEDANADDIKRWKKSYALYDRLQELAADIPNGGWVYDGYDDGNVIFRPVFVGKWGNRLLWPHGNKFLMMSSTILSGDLRAEEWGLSKPHHLISLPSPFPAANRPVFVVPIADMSYSYNKETNKQGWRDMVKGVRGVLRLHPDERVLVHTVSYELARYLVDHLADSGRPIHTYTNSDGKAEALDDLRRYPNGVLVASSMGRGIDLPDDLCRVQIVTKIPNPNLADRRTKKRLRSQGGRVWYRLQAIAELIQMTGRGVRSETDHAKTYILDTQFNEIWKSNFLFPAWWKKAVQFRTSALRRRILEDV